MQINTNDMPCGGARLCGATLRPSDSDSQYGISQTHGFTCGFTVETGRSNPFLRLTPAVQVPKCGREGFERWQLNHEDDAVMDLRLDQRDGEVTVRLDLRSTRPEDVEPVLAEALDWVGAVAIPQVMGYIRSLY